MPFTYPYPRPAVTCDSVVFTMGADDLSVLLIRRKDEPFAGAWALPGGFVNQNESLERAARRELAEETGITGLKLRQLGAFGDPGRDPRGHTITVAFVAFAVATPTPAAGDDAADAEWLPLRTLMLSERAPKASAAPRRKRAAAETGVRLAFDHAKILRAAHLRLCRHLDNPVHDPEFELLPPRFTMAQLQRTYELVLGRPLDAREFKARALGTGIVVVASARPAPRASAQLYRWNRAK